MSLEFVNLLGHFSIRLDTLDTVDCIFIDSYPDCTFFRVIHRLRICYNNGRYVDSDWSVSTLTYIRNPDRYDDELSRQLNTITPGKFTQISNLFFSKSALRRSNAFDRRMIRIADLDGVETIYHFHSTDLAVVDNAVKDANESE